MSLPRILGMPRGEEHTQEPISARLCPGDDLGISPLGDAATCISMEEIPTQLPGIAPVEERDAAAHEPGDLLMADANLSGKLPSDPVAVQAEGSSREIVAAQNLEPTLWDYLPDHILEHVLAYLPFWSIFRLRSVSKKWNHKFASRQFLDSCSRQSSREVLFIMFADFLRLKAAATYNPALDKWHLVPLSLFHPCEPPSYFLILATAGGLLCLEEIAWPNRSLFVSNPMNKSYKKLPPMLQMKCPYVVGMMMDADSKGYRILVAQDGEPLVSQCYESRSDSWKMNSTLNRRVALIAGTTSFEGFFICLTFGPVGLVAYNIEESSWHELEITLPSSIAFPHVMECNRQLVVVGGLEEYGSLTSIRIWQLDLSRHECTEVERMPHHLFHRLTSSGREHFFCVGQAGLICFNDGTTPDILMYDMAVKRWWWLPPCPLHYSLKRHSGYAFKTLGFPIEPRFDVSA